jgi:hypothetical protein
MRYEAPETFGSAVALLSAAFHSRARSRGRELDAALLVIRTAKVRAEPLPFALPPKDGAYLKDRFRRALLGDSGTAL